jgi:hypothetical protein
MVDAGERFALLGVLLEEQLFQANGITGSAVLRVRSVSSWAVSAGAARPRAPAAAAVS